MAGRLSETSPRGSPKSRFLKDELYAQDVEGVVTKARIADETRSISLLRELRV